MKRMHLFEFEDQRWFPDLLRDYVTDFLWFTSSKLNIFAPTVPLLRKALAASGTKTIVDLGSGGGGGLIRLNEALRKEIPDLRIVLTDLYPNRAAFERTARVAPNLDYVAEPVDARKVPAKLVGVRTQFLSLHHFLPGDATQIIQNAVDTNHTLAVFEAQERSLGGLVGMLFSPLFVLLATPLIRPFRLGRLLSTYLIPIVPLVVLWDGLVSVLRTYSTDEMRALVGGVRGKENYTWDIGKIKGRSGTIQYLIATPS